MVLRVQLFYFAFTGNSSKIIAYCSFFVVYNEKQMQLKYEGLTRYKMEYTEVKYLVCSSTVRFSLSPGLWGDESSGCSVLYL